LHAMAEPAPVAAAVAKKSAGSIRRWRGGEF
jgi:hypothetical protein